MKAGLATSLSIAGVIVTGGAALALNSSILDTETSTKGSPAFATVVGLEKESGVMPLGDGATPHSAAELSASGVVDLLNGDRSSHDAPSGAIPTTTATPASTPPSAAAVSTTPAVQAAEKQFKVGDVATITLVVDGTRLLVKNVVMTTGTNYRVTNQVSRDGDDVRITIASPTRAIDFSARLVNGQIVAAVSEPSSSNLNQPRPVNQDDGHDDDDRDERRDDENEEHHEREHDNDD